MVLAAVVVAVATIRREFYASRPPVAAADNNQPPTFVEGWQGFAANGVLLGNSAAPIRLIEFADLECPFCAKFHARALQLKKLYPGRVAVVFVHFPLSVHRFARPAARAAECAGEQGRFEAFIGGVFEKRDSLGLKTWQSFASDAKVGDTVRFARCASASGALRRVDSGVQLGTRLSVTATPTVIINGWRFAHPPYDSLPEIVARLTAGDRLDSRKPK